MSQSIAQAILDFFGDTYFGVFIIAMLPIVELRLAVPLGVALGFPLLPTLLVAIAGNILPVPFLLLFSQKLLAWLGKLKGVGGFFQRFNAKAEARAARWSKHELWALFLFVAIPLPGTGAWTGSVVAAILHLNWKRAILAVVAGVVTAGIIMTLLSATVFGPMLGFDLSFN